MNIEIKRVTDWQRVVDAARMTVHRGALGHEPTEGFKKTMLMSEHSPIRLLEYDVTITDVPYYVTVHLCRHFMGIEKFVATSREDRTGVERTTRKQTDLVDCQFSLNAQAFINISRRRLCSCADPKTKFVWNCIVGKLHEVEPLLAERCVPQCIYRGFCPEPSSCGYCNMPIYEKRLKEYRNGR